MKHYYVNKSTVNNPNNNNEVHVKDCMFMPVVENREYLGYFTNGKEAVAAAKRKGYYRADGCAVCCLEAHNA